MATIEERSSEAHVNKLIDKYFKNDFIEDYAYVGEEKTCMGIYYNKYADAIKNFKVHDDDVYVASYVKTGTTWTQEMVWLLANNFDYEGAKLRIEERFPFLEFCTVFNYEKMDKAMEIETPTCITDSVNFATNMARPRLIKTHLAHSLLPQQLKDGVKTPKLIYVMRNPRDVCVSYYHHGRYLHGWPATFPEFLDVFLSEKIMFGSFWKHILGYWNLRKQPNVLIITFEEMKADLSAVVKKVAKFLGKELTEQQMEKLLHHLSFESMKQNESVNYEKVIEVRRKHKFVSEGSFMRSGTVGSYKKEMTTEDIERINAWSRKYVENTGFAEEYKDYV